MAIINKPQPEAAPEEKPKGIIPGGAGGPLPPEPEVGATLQLPWGGIIAGLLLVATVAGVVLNLDKLANLDSVFAAKSLNAEIVELQVDKLVRAGGLIDLTQKKIAQNRDAFQKAEQRQDTVIADTMKLALAQNQNDLTEYQATFVATLTELHAVFREHPGAVEEQLKARLQQSDDTFKLGNAKAIARALKLLKGVPEGANVRAHFEEKINAK